MAPTIHTIFLILAIICFGLAAFGISTPRGNLVAAGLFLLTLALIIKV